jgi:hypothetical protein
MEAHNLGTLYLNLPLELRKAIKITYDAIPKKLAPSYRPGAVQVAISHRAAPDSERFRTLAWQSDVSLRALLERNSDLFLRWRYLWDQGQPGTVQRVYYEYQCLEAAADALREHTTRAINLLVEAERTGQTK